MFYERMPCQRQRMYSISECKTQAKTAVKLTKGMRFIWSATKELAAEKPAVGKRLLTWPFLECKRIVYTRRKWWRFWEKKAPLLYEFEVMEEV